jgi:hypothetical protein
VAGAAVGATVVAAGVQAALASMTINNSRDKNLERIVYFSFL